MKLDEFFRCVGGDYGEAKARFQNDERIVRFLNMFPGDDSMQNLKNAMNLISCLLSSLSGRLSILTIE